MSIQIPCPRCGRELKLPDRSLLGRRGKCPQCSHTFVLEEPPVVQLELAGPEPAVTRAPVSNDVRIATVSIQNPQPVAPETTIPAFVVPPEFVALDQLARPKGAAARLKELQKKNARRRNIGLGVAALILVAVAAVALIAPKYAAKPATTSTESVANTAESRPAIDNDPSGPASTKYAKHGSPTKGKPIDLRYIPFGTQVVLNLHPAELWKEMSLGEELRYCVPPLATLIEKTLNDLFKRKPEQVEELLICLLPGPRGSLPDVAAVAHMVEDQKRSQLIEQFGQRIDTWAQPVYLTGDRAYMIVDQKTLVVGPQSQAQEMVQAINSPHPAEQLDPLLAMTDRDRHFTAVFTPLTVGLQDGWFPDNVRPFVKNSLDWLGDETETVGWSMHVNDDLFYSEILLRFKGLPAKKMEQNFKTKLATLASDLVPLFQQMNPREAGKRMVIGRVPAMVEVFSMATIPDHGPNYARFITPLPDRAAPNLVLGTLLAWDESTRTDFSRAKPGSSEGPKLPDLVADRMKMKIDVDFRLTPFNEAFTFIGGEIKTQINVDGDALKLGGFTKNIVQSFKMDGARTQDIVLKIFENSRGISNKPETNLVIIADESQKTILVTTEASAIQKGLQPYSFAK